MDKCMPVSIFDTNAPAFIPGNADPAYIAEVAAIMKKYGVTSLHTGNLEMTMGAPVAEAAPPRDPFEFRDPPEVEAETVSDPLKAASPYHWKKR